ncbi:hypothetical protein THI4931_42420 [Pandoraea sputorum]|nr:hypothetical protein THI4931_42420 [Pandoraea sputorum]
MLIQIGARVMVRLGHCRSGMLTGVNGRYFVAGFFNMAGLDCQQKCQPDDAQTQISYDLRLDEPGLRSA